MQKFPIYSEKFRLYIVLFHCHNAEHQHSTPISARSHELHRLYFLRRQARAHFRNSKTEQKSRSDCAQLTEMQRIL